jgi:hypothetical protein
MEQVMGTGNEEFHHVYNLAPSEVKCLTSGREVSGSNLRMGTEWHSWTCSVLPYNELRHECFILCPFRFIIYYHQIILRYLL